MSDQELLELGWVTLKESGPPSFEKLESLPKWLGGFEVSRRLFAKSRCSEGMGPRPFGDEREWKYVWLEWSLAEAIRGRRTPREIVDAVLERRLGAIAEMAWMLQGVFMASFGTLGNHWKANPELCRTKMLRGEWMAETSDEGGVVRLSCAFAFDFPAFGG